MAAIKMQLGYKCSEIEIPIIFIDNYMTGCPPVYPLIYIYALRKLLSNETVSSDEIAVLFGLTESDVKNAWKHWEKMKLVKIENIDDSEQMKITFLPVVAPSPQVEHVGFSAPVVVASRPQYTPQELKVYRNQCEDIERLFKRAEQTLGKLLTHNDLNTIFSLHDWLRLPIDVIEYLLTYCAENDHRNLRYIEKCALDWADNQINDLEKALSYVQFFDRDYRTVLNYMGQVNAYPSPSHRKYIDKWLKDWAFPMPLVLEAIDRCVHQIDKPKFSYIEKILSEWHKSGIKTMEAVQLASDKFISEKKKSTNATTVTPQKTSKFVNFNQREINYAELEKLERMHQESHLKNHLFVSSGGG